MSEAKEKMPVNWQRLGQGLVALLLVCCLVVNVSPVKAKAVEPVTVMIGASIVIASVLIGLGIMMGSDPIVFDELVQKVAQDDEVSKIISVNFELPVIKYNATTGGLDPDKMGWAVGWTLIEAIRQVLFDEEVVSSSPAPDGYAYYNGVLLPVIPEFDSDLTYLSIMRAETVEDWYFVVASSFKPYYLSSTQFCNSTPGYKRDALLVLSKGVWTYNTSRTRCPYPDYSVGGTGIYIWSNFDVYDKTGATLYYTGSDPVLSYSSVADGLTAGEIAPQEQELSEGYPDWFSGSIFDENADEYWFPIGIGQTYDETKTYTQEQVQNGEGTYIVADSPVYNVNLPLAGSLTYERFATAQPLTVSASVTDGGTIRYEWFRYQMEPSLGASESVGEGVSIVPDTSNVGKWTYYCKATNTVSNVSSLPVTSNYVTVTIIDPNEQENPDISPTEAPGVDPDPGGDPDPGVDPDLDPDNQTDLENSGNENVDHLIEIIPDHSGEFGETLKALADSMSYEGTDAILTIPQVNFPALGNLVPGFVMMEEQQINFADYVEMMPSNLLLLVRCLLTAALIMYCFYELYSTTEYVLVLRRD